MVIFSSALDITRTYFAKHQSQKGHYDANMTAGMLGGIITIPAILLIQIAPSPIWAFIFYAPALAAVNSPAGIAAGALPVITPPHLRARVAAVYMLTGAIGMMFGLRLPGHLMNLFPRRGRGALFNDDNDLFLRIIGGFISAFGAQTLRPFHEKC